jgi:3-hydroxymyristoyl/3-hydroxydecanoyl-(acyl carrier protein) dehydratase
MPGVDWRIAADPVDDALEVRSPHLADTNWLRLADRAQAIDGGRFVLRGRADRIVKIEEKRVSLDMIQARLAASPLVAEVRVLMLDATAAVATDVATAGAADVAAGRRQRVAAFVVPSASGRAILAEIGKLAFNRLLRDSLTDAVERVALPRSWRYLEALPVDAQGKTTYAELLTLLDQEDAPHKARPILPRQRLLERDAMRAVFELVAPSDLLYFDGHFSQAPILPGVVQLDWAIAFGRAHFDLPPVFLGVHALKFQRVIQPEMAFQLELRHEQQKSSLSFRFSSAAGQHASGRILFGAAGV